jgi:hypothetical protein
MTITKQLANNLLGHIYLGQEYINPINVYLGLLDESISEIQGGGYHRLNVNQSFSSPIDGSIQNTIPIVWPNNAEGDWETAHYVAFYDAITDGNKLQIARLAQPIDVKQGQRLRFLPNSLFVTFGDIIDGLFFNYT